MTFGRPISVGRTMPSSTMICEARSTRSSSPSQKTTRFFAAVLATAKMGLMAVPDA